MAAASATLGKARVRLGRVCALRAASRRGTEPENCEQSAMSTSAVQRHAEAPTNALRRPRDRAYRANNELQTVDMIILLI